MDTLEMQIQQVSAAQGRVITLPLSDPANINTILPPYTARANQTLIFDSGGNVAVGSFTGVPVSPAMQPIVDASSLALCRKLLGVNNEVSVASFGAVSDAKKVTDISCASGSANISSASGLFTSSDVGKTIKIYDIQNNVYAFLGTIAAVPSATTAILSGMASATVIAGNGIAYWGTDNATAINAALSYASLQIQQDYGQVNAPSGTGYCRVIFPLQTGTGSGYLFGSTLTTYRNVILNADAMLFNACGGSSSDRTWAITCAAGIQIERLVMECGGGMGIYNGTGEMQSSSFIGQCQLWNVGTTYSGGTSQIGLYLTGNDYTITGLWIKGGNIGCQLYQASDVRISLPEIIGSASGMQLAGCENIQINNVTFDTCSYIGLTIDGSHNIFASGNLFSVNGTGLNYGITLGLNDHFNINRDINLNFNMQRCGGIGVHIAYTQDSTLTLNGSNSANYSAGGIAITQMVEYGSGNAGIINVTATRDNVTAGAAIANFTGSLFGMYYDTYNNSGTATTEVYGGAFIFPSAPAGFGAWVSASANTVYQAATDGIIVAQLGSTGSVGLVCDVYTDSNNPPTTVRTYLQDNGDYPSGVPGTCPVRAGDYWKVGSGANLVFWLPLGI